MSVEFDVAQPYSQTDLTAVDQITCWVILDCRLQYFVEFATNLGYKCQRIDSKLTKIYYEKCKYSWHKC